MTQPTREHTLLERIEHLETRLASVREERDQLKLERRRWQGLMSESPFGVVVYRPDGTIKAANDGMQRLFMLSDEDAEVARSVYNVLEDPQLVEKGLAEPVRRAFAGQPAQLPTVEYELRTQVEKKTIKKWIEGVFFPIFEPKGTVREIVSIQIDVSDLAQAREDLRRSRDVMGKQLRELDQLYDAEPVGLCLVDTELRFLRINEKMAEINGVTVDGHLGKTIREVMPELADRIEPLYKRVLETGEPLLDFEIHGVTPADPETLRDWLVSYYPIVGDDGSANAVTSVVQEITPIKRAEEALAASQRQLRTIIDNADLVLWALDEEGVFTLSEGQALASLGLRPGEVVGRSIFDVYADTPQILEDTRKALSGQAVATNVDVGDLTFAARYLPVLDDKGRSAGAIGVAIDITDRRKAEAALARSEQRFRQIADNMSELFWVLDPHAMEFIYMSPSYERLTGRPVAEVNSKTNGLFADIPTQDMDVVESARQRLLEHGGNVAFEHRLVHKDGSTRWVAVRASAVRDENGTITHLAGFTEDITEKKVAEEERQRFEAKVRQAQKLESLGLLAGGIAHDFNNLLMGVLGNADLAALTLTPESAGYEYVERIRVAAQRASELANQMLAYSGKGRFVVGALDLNRLVQETKHLLDAAISKKVQLSLDLGADLPAIEGDANQMRQIVMNLITNASEAVGEESGVIRISTSVVDADERLLSRCELGVGLPPGLYVRLDVSDTGTGIPGDVRGKMFDPFFTTKFTGRGLGLAAALGIVQSHGAALCVETEVDKGSTFSVLFPPSSSLPASPPRSDGKDVRTPSGGTILVVDDEAIVREVAQAMLENAGFSVVCASDGHGALDILSKPDAEIALVLLDMAMPGLDGRETFERLRRIQPTMRVVFSSGYSEEETITKLDTMGRIDFVQKPYRMQDLLEKIRGVLGVSQTS